MTEKLLLVLAPTANGHRAHLDGQREAWLLKFALMKEQGADQGDRLWGGHTRYNEGIKGMFAQAAHSGLAGSRMSGRRAGSSSCSSERLQGGTTEMGPVAHGRLLLRSWTGETSCRKGQMDLLYAPKILALETCLF